MKKFTLELINQVDVNNLNISMRVDKNREKVEVVLVHDNKAYLLMSVGKKYLTSKKITCFDKNYKTLKGAYDHILKIFKNLNFTIQDIENSFVEEENKEQQQELNINEVVEDKKENEEVEQEEKNNITEINKEEELNVKEEQEEEKENNNEVIEEQQEENNNESEVIEEEKENNNEVIEEQQEEKKINDEVEQVFEQEVIEENQENFNLEKEQEKTLDIESEQEQEKTLDIEKEQEEENNNEVIEEEKNNKEEEEQEEEQNPLLNVINNKIKKGLEKIDIHISKKDIMIDCTCKAYKGEDGRYTLFKMFIGNDNNEFNYQIIDAMQQLMNKYLYFLKDENFKEGKKFFKGDTAKYNTYVGIMENANKKEKEVMLPFFEDKKVEYKEMGMNCLQNILVIPYQNNVGEIRKYVHIVYFLAKKEIVKTYKDIRIAKLEQEKKLKKEQKK